MTIERDSEPRDPRQRFVEQLNLAHDRRLRIPFWWRDDDAIDATPALDKLIATARRHAIPLALAVVPKPATKALAERVAREPNISVLQHGWTHRNHAAEGEKKAELGDHRSVDAVLDDLRLGFAKLANLFGSQFLPVLVPPWNRIGDINRAARHAAGLIGLSTFGPAPPNDRRVVNVHLDIFEWHPARRTLQAAEAYAILAEELQDRLDGNREPIGLMCHHLVHDDAAWALLEDLLGTLAKHPAVIWPETPKLFGLPSSLSQRIA